MSRGYSLALRSSEADRQRLLDSLQHFGPLDVEVLRNKTMFASWSRFRAAVRDLKDLGLVDDLQCGRGYRIIGDARPVNFDETEHTRIKREQRARKAAMGVAA